MDSKGLQGLIIRSQGRNGLQGLLNGSWGYVWLKGGFSYEGVTDGTIKRRNAHYVTLKGITY